MTKKLDFDIVLWGGSSFVGKLVAEHLHQTYGVDAQVRWAVGGRNQHKLKDTRSWLGAGAAIANKIIPRLIENAGMKFDLLTEAGEPSPVRSDLFCGDEPNADENQMKACATQ